MKGHYYKPHCKCPGLNKKKCKCGAKWAFIIDLGKKPDGSRNPKKRGGFDTKDDAEAAAAIMLEQYKTNTLPEDVARREAEERLRLEEQQKEEEWVDISFSDLAEKWFETYKSTGKIKRPNTIKNRRNDINRIVVCFDKPAREITHDEYQEVLRQMKNGTHKIHKKKFSTNTISVTHATAKMIFEFGIKFKHIEENPAKGAHVPHDYQTVEDIESWENIPDFLERDELIVFLDTAYLHGSPLDYEIFTMLAYTGLRIGELEALQEYAFNTESNKIRIIKNYIGTNNYKKFELGPPKTKSSIRELDIDPEIKVMILKLIETHKVLKEKISTHLDQGFIFAQTVGQFVGYPIPEGTINKRMKRLLRISGLNKDLSPHSLRHTFTSLMAAAGVPLEQVMEMLGHAGDEITKRVYLHTTKNQKKDAVIKYSDFLKNTINRD
ncbi:tyrosine-type recombinase/integrase [Paenibacillus sp. FSL K6-1217]|uniref:tyrosine-type recombinase/integrase n=1 Tax=Paenibacillus sp. FSL K6-1217 TaxID=2921466 RepID=UPI00325607FD